MTASLSPDLLTTLIALLTPHIQTPHERLSLFTRAFTSVDEALLRRIDFTGSIDDFAPPMLRTLAIAPRQEEVSALWRLLLIVHADTGEDQRKQIDALKERIHAITPLDTPEALPTIPEEALPRRRGGTPRLFISYSQADRTLVLEIARRLSRDFSYDVWIDVNNLPGGKDWMEELARGVQSADVILFMATPNACASRYCRMEIDHARMHHKRIIPIRLADGIDLDAAGLPPRAHYVDGMSGIDTLLNKLTQPDNLPPVLARDRRLLDPHFRELHRRYLRTLFRRYGTVRLKQQLGVELGREVSLFDVYVPLKLGVSFNIEVHDGEMIDWWMRDQTQGRQKANDLPEGTALPKSLKGFTPQGEPLGVWVDGMRAEWVRFKQEHAEEQQKKDEKERKPLEDGTYFWNRLSGEVAPALMPHVVITGGAGSGKSTLVQHLALCMAGELLHDDDSAKGHSVRADLSRLDFFPLPTYTPLIVELRRLIKTQLPNLTDEPTPTRFLDYLDAEFLHENGCAEYRTHVEAQLESGDAIIILDGLDEVPDAKDPHRREQIKTLARMLREHYPDCRIVVTSRPYAYDDWSLDGFGRVDLVDLDPDRLELLARRLFTVVRGESAAEALTAQFLEQIKEVDEELRRSPLMFTLLASVWLNSADGKLPADRPDLYRACFDQSIARWKLKDSDGDRSILERLGVSESDLRRLLEVVAYGVHQDGGGGSLPSFDSGTVLTVARRDLKLRGVDYDALIESLGQRSGVLYERQEEELQFVHRSFQEHLAACHLAITGFPAQFLNHLRANPVLWKEVSDLLPAEARRAGKDVWEMVKAVLPKDAAPLPVDSPEWHAIRYVGGLLLDTLPADDDRQEIYRPRLQKRLVEAVTLGVLTPVERAEMGRQLSRVGDPRPGVGLRPDGLPDIDWVTIPSGEFIYGDDNKKDYPDYAKPADRQIVTLPTFQMSRYLITYAQFQTFIDAPDGWSNPQWWEGLSASDEHKAQPGYQAFKFGNHPRENVSWYDAVAFCRWLSAKLGYTVTLPTEQQYERAARWMDGRLYPWGNDYISGNANIDEVSSKAGKYYLQQTSAVGIYSQGASVEGAHDLSGNVWEWCLNEYSTPENTQDSGTNRRVLRGGSWDLDRDLVRAAFRDHINPGIRGYAFGFRVVVSSPIMNH